MLKNFQLHFPPKALQAESDAWRAVIHLNLVRSVNFILDLLSNTIPSHATPYASSSGCATTTPSVRPTRAR